MPLTTYYPGQNKENYDSSVRIATYLGKVKRSKDEMNIQSKCHENENSSPLQVFCRRDKTHSNDINFYFLIKEVGRKQRHLDSVWVEVKCAVCQRRVTVRKCMALVTFKLKKKIKCCYMIYGRR